MRIKTGEKIHDFEISTHLGETLLLSDVYKKNKHTLLLFLRYYGCPVCQLDLKEYKEQYNEFKENDTEVIIVLQSDPNTFKGAKVDFPYLVACDPEKKLYELFEINAAKSTFGLLSLKVISKVMKVKKLGIEHGEYEGEELQLPAAFFIDATGKVAFSRYAKNLCDLPSVNEFIQMSK